jgi:2-iminobutanoate/2-iminopropanoate deaminase
MSRKIISTDKAPQAVGPYSQAVVLENLNLVFVSGQIALPPGSKEIIRGGIVEEVKQVLENLKNILEATGSSLDKVVKTTVFLRSMDDFGLMNETYNQYFKANFPARSTVQVAALPKGARVEIEAIAYLD